MCGARWVPSVVTTVTVAALMACTPAGTPASSPSATVAENTPASSRSATPEEVPTSKPTLSGTVEALPDEQYPAEVGGFTFTRTLGTIHYDRGGTSEGDRIVVNEQLYVEPAAEWFEGANYNHQELLPGVWCYRIEEDFCAVNGTTGRLWVARNMYGSLTMDEFAAWSADFAIKIP